METNELFLALLSSLWTEFPKFEIRSALLAYTSIPFIEPNQPIPLSLSLSSEAPSPSVDLSTRLGAFHGVFNLKMTTTEKLIVRIFERKKLIVEQVKLQTDLYNEHLASKLLLDGINPPQWLRNPNFNSESSDPEGILCPTLSLSLTHTHIHTFAPLVRVQLLVKFTPLGLIWMLRKLGKRTRLT